MTVTTLATNHIAPQDIVQHDPMVSMIERVAMDPNLPIERLTALMDMRERQMNKEAEQVFNRAFAEAMADMPDVKRTGHNKHLNVRYSTLDDLIHATRPVLSRYGLSLNWQSGIDGEKITVTAIVRHAHGHSIQTTLSGQRDNGKTMNALQGGGSTETYLKRYTGFAILGLSSGDEADDDGQAAGTASTVSAEQYVIIRDLLESSGMDPVKFHAAFGTKNPTEADLKQFPANRFDDAKARLEKFIAAKGKANV